MSPYRQGVRWQTLIQLWFVAIFLWLYKEGHSQAHVSRAADSTKSEAQQGARGGAIEIERERESIQCCTSKSKRGKSLVGSRFEVGGIKPNAKMQHHASREQTISSSQSSTNFLKAGGHRLKQEYCSTACSYFRTCERTTSPKRIYIHIQPSIRLVLVGA